MATRDAFAFSALALLAACATAQENPNYKYSSRYQAPAPAQPVQQAVFEAPTAVVEEVPVYRAAEPVSETEEAFDASTMDGTPGYQIFVAESEQAALAPAPAAPTLPPLSGEPVEVETQRPRGATRIEYDYSQNVIIADAQTQIEPTEVRRRGSALATHTVQPGDTVYNISRRLCVGVADVVAAGSVGEGYAIRIGDVINVPESRC